MSSIYDSAFERIYQDYYEPIVRWLYNHHVGNHELAEDLAQQTFLSAWQAYSPEKETYLFNWLRHIAKNKVRDHFRALKRTTWETNLDIGSAQAYLQPVVFADIERQCEQQENFYAFLATLTPEQRELLLLMKEKYTLPECAKILHLPESTLRMRLQRLRRKLGVLPLHRKTRYKKAS